MKNTLLLFFLVAAALGQLDVSYYGSDVCNTTSSYGFVQIATPCIQTYSGSTKYTCTPDASNIISYKSNDCTGQSSQNIGLPYIRCTSYYGKQVCEQNLQITGILATVYDTFDCSAQSTYTYIFKPNNCTGSKLANGLYESYTCVSNAITKTVYYNAQCSGTPYSIQNYASSNCSSTDVGYLKVSSCNSTFTYSTPTPRQSIKNDAARYIGILYIYILLFLINNFF